LDLILHQNRTSFKHLIVAFCNDYSIIWSCNETENWQQSLPIFAFITTPNFCMNIQNLESLRSKLTSGSIEHDLLSRTCQFLTSHRTESRRNSSRPSTAPSMYALASVGTLRGPILFQVKLFASFILSIFEISIKYMRNDGEFHLIICRRLSCICYFYL
jgi:hypothetical protein